ncbi:GNAT family N-acetyltransferase [Microbacterium sp. NPDC091662]|uniref:GNAT family N-acetyltransferase n=1 Tax=Microbacterium sp. NPDC091662 TaxID=3364211 RepID=UPI0038260139
MTDIVAGGIPEDIDRCIEVWIHALRDRDGDVDSRSVADRMRRLFDGPVLRFALTGERLAGFALTTPKTNDETTAVLERLAVLPSSAGQGHGRALLRDAIRYSSDAGFVSIELAVRRGNAAIRLYESEGFAPVSTPVPHPLGGEPMITYRRGLIDGHRGFSAAPSALSVPRVPGPGIVLRPFEASDIDAVLDASFDRSITDVTTVPFAADHGLAGQWLVRQHERAAAGIGYSFAIEANEGCVGQIGLWLRDRDQGRATVGYWIRPARRGQGYAHSALRTLTEWAWHLSDLHRLQLHIDPTNVPSLRTAERAGYTREGLLHSWQKVGDERRDMLVYSRLRSPWPIAEPAADEPG